MSESQSVSNDALSLLGFSETDVEEELRKNRLAPPSKQVCICGHAVNKHSELSQGRWTCQTANHICPCQGPEPVLVVQDTRYFMKKTEGYGPMHAISYGLMRLRQEKKWARFIIDLKCDRCKAENCKLYPTALSPELRIVRRPSSINKFLCIECLELILGINRN
ncbi:MAG: hypothetical protein RL228_370 [Actinomycetota bacterium]|jgi:hypothetical protein